MKRFILLVLVISGFCSLSYGEMVGFEGGVIGDPTIKKDTYNYEEMLFITGEPVLLSGTVAVPQEPTGKTSYTLQYKYDLVNTDKSIKLTRKVSLDVTETPNTVFKQTQYKAKISQYQESIAIGSTKYTLDGYLFTKSLLYDNTPAVDYFSGNVYGKRTYYVSGTATSNKGKVVIETTGDTLIGYKHHWGSSNTAVILQTLTGEMPNPSYSATGDNRKSITWEGFASLRLSTVDKKTFEKITNSPQTISFRSGYIQNLRRENIMQYQYDLPRLDTKGVPTTGRNSGENSLRRDALMDSESLFSPKFRDAGNHWAEQSIFLMASLNIFGNDSVYFSPDTPITRGDFARAVANALEKVKPLTAAEKTKLKRDKTAAKLFEDITVDDDLYPVAKMVQEKGVMKGENNYFLPERNLRRAEAIEIIINAMGISHMAPSPPFSTGYIDDSEIPNWAKNSVYMAKEVGLVTGFEGYIHPDEMITRAEAAVLVEKFINHIREQINYDYREKIINNL